MAGQFPSPVRRPQLPHLLLVKGEKNHAAYEVLGKGKIKRTDWNNHEQKRKGCLGDEKLNNRKQITLRRKEADAGPQRKEFKNYF